MSNYDPKVHSKDKLGLAIHALIVPAVPTGAQVSPTSGNLHIQLPGGVYVNVYRPMACILPEDWKPIVEALPTLPDENSYSGSDSKYKKLTVEPQLAMHDAQPVVLVRVGPGGPIMARIYVDPLIPIASTDEDPLTQEIPTAQGQSPKAIGSPTIAGISVDPVDPVPATPPAPFPLPDGGPDTTQEQPPIDSEGEDGQAV